MSPLSRYVLRNLSVRPFITLVTIFSLGLTAFALTAATSAVLGLRKAFINTGSPKRVYVLSKDASVATESDVKHDTIVTVSANPEIVAASPEIAFVAIFVNAGFSHEDMIGYALDDKAFEMYAPRLLEGRLPQRGQPELIVGVTLRDRHPLDVTLGNELNLYMRRKYKIVGVFETGTIHDSELYAPRDAVAQDTRKEGVNRMVLETHTPDEAVTLADRLSSGKLGIAAISESHYLENVLKGFRPIVANIALLLLFVVAGAALAATSTLSVIFRQRIGEMAVLRAMGFRTSRVVGLLIKEAMALALVGATAGAGLATVLLMGRTEYVDGTIPLTFHSAVTPPAVGVAFIGMIIVGMIAVIGPIVTVIRLEIKDSIREGA